MLYVDKTRYISKLADYGTYYFLSRPRRFGKSLFQDTLKEYFEGNRSLFSGLYIDREKPGEWPKHPVLRFDLSGNKYLDEGSIGRVLRKRLRTLEKSFGVEVEEEDDISIRFEELIEAVAGKTGSQVVVLIDEYDAPLSSAIDAPELHEAFRLELHGFYSVLKKCEEHIRFCFLTGVTRYGKVSVFSGINNLNDITFDDEYAGICGVTEDELHEYYSEGVSEFAEKLEVKDEEAFRMLKYYYDGYHFTENLTDVYNPYSLNYALAKCKIKEYWCESGTPALFTKMLMKMDFDIERLVGVTVKEKVLSNLSAFAKNPIPLFFQSGYLTLKSYDPESQMFTLGYPNREVESGIMSDILQTYNPTVDEGSEVLERMKESLLVGNPEAFVGAIRVYLSQIPGPLKKRVARYENYYHTVIYCLLSLLGLETRAEFATADGYIDLLIKTQKFIYVIELKLNGTARDAMDQIKSKRYTDPFKLETKKLCMIAIGFSKETKNISDYIIDRGL